MHVLLTEEQELFRRTVREFAEREIAPVAAEHDEQETFPTATVRMMGKLGLMGLTLPEEYGGQGGGTVEYALAMEEIARADASHSVVLTVQSSLVCEPILKYGTDEQKNDYLKRLASGDLIGSFCLSEPQSGSDARNMQTTASRDGDYYVLNGTKNWISNGGESGLYLVFARLTGEDEDGTRTAAFLVEYWRFGIRCGPKEKKLGIRASATTQVFLQDCRVPVGNMLGAPGDGFKIAMTSLDGGRIGVAAQALGIAQAAFDAAVAYAQERQAFGQPISELQAIQFMLADMQVRIEQSRSLVYQSAVLKAKGQAYAKASAMAKLSASETAMWVTTKAIQIHGGYGYSREYAVQRYFRDAKITEIYEGTSEIQRLVIARSILRGERPLKVAADAEETAADVPETLETKTPTIVLPPTPEEERQMRAPRKLHHVAVAVDNLDEALKYYRDILGLDEITTMTLDDRGLKVGLIKAGPSEIELLEPLHDDSTVARFLDRRGPGLHHICFEVEDVEKSMRYYEGKGATFIDPVPRPGAVGLVSFMPPVLADGVLVELAQTSGYELPTPEGEAEAVAEEQPPVVITRPIIRGAGGYTRAGLMAAQPVQPKPAPESASASDEAEAATVITQPIVRGAGGYTRPGLTAQQPVGAPVAAPAEAAVPAEAAASAETAPSAEAAASAETAPSAEAAASTEAPVSAEAVDDETPTVTIARPPVAESDKPTA
ncbi:MAG: methylmalonyl-CoA epimerase [Chloroflexi bacterium]|nr:methylmalonyl-CoA epimerase [Chloroflexota bacterium]